MSDIETTHNKFKIEKFDGKGDFGMWKCKLLMQLELQDLEPIIVEEGEEDPDSDIEIMERGSKKWRMNVYSKKVRVYFLKTKDEAFGMFNEWKEAVENLTRKKIKIFRTDNSLEFCNNQFDTLCKESEITRHKMCAYTPQQNGVAERMNRTLMEKVRCMLAESELGEQFWAEATSSTTYITFGLKQHQAQHQAPSYL